MNIADPTDDTMTDLDDLRVDLAIYRSERRVSARWVALAAGISTQTVYDFEQGSTQPHAYTVQAIASLVRAS